MNKPTQLTTTFYRNFMLLIVVPILLIILITLGVLRNLMLRSAFNTIDIAQNTIAASLKSDIDTNSLKMAHFLLTNNKEALELADKIAASTGKEKYITTNKLKALCNLVVAPSSDIIAIHFYTKDGQVISLKDELALPLEEIRNFDFYKKALENPNHTNFGLINATFTIKKNLEEPRRKALAISFSPSGAGSHIETICWYTHTQANRDINQFAADEKMGESFLADSGGNLLMAPNSRNLKYSLPDNVQNYTPGRHRISYGGKHLNLIIRNVQGTDWRIATVVENSTLLQNFNNIAAIVLLASCIIFFLFYIFSAIFLRNIITPVNELTSGMAQVEKGNLETRLEPAGQDEIRTLMESFNSMIAQTQELMLANEEQHKEKMAAEMRALQSQINPHFLVNSLNSIRFTAMVAKFDSIRNMSEALIKILNASFKDPGTLYTVRDEIEMLESYVYLMKIRYSENFDVSWEIDPASLDCKIPRLLIQPLAENAIIHGFEDQEEPGKINVSILLEGSTLKISVSDDGKGIDPNISASLLTGTPAQSNNGHGIGIANVHRRIQLNYGTAYGISIDSNPGEGSCFTIIMPAEKTQEGTDA